MKTLIEAVVGRKFTVVRDSDRWARTKEHDSLVLNLEDGTFFWNSEGIYGGPYKWLTRVESLSHNNAVKVLEELSKRYPSNYHVQFQKGNTVVTYPRLVDIFWENGKAFREYWYTRCLTDETIDKFRLGFFDGWFTVPVFEEYTLKNIQMRRDFPEKKITKWYSGTGVSLWGDDVLKDSNWVVFTEGLVDAILLRQYNIPSITTDAGSGGWREDFLVKFIRQELIYIVFDNDDAGRKGAKRLARKLGANRCRIITFDGFRDKYDIVDWFRDGKTDKEFLDYISNNYYMIE